MGWLKFQRVKLRNWLSFGCDSTVNPHADIVVIRFPNLVAADGWFKSEAYQALIPLREQAADVMLTSYET